MSPTNSERLIGISDAFSAFVYGYPSSSPRAQCNPNKSVTTLRYTRRPVPIYTGHACRHWPSAVPWISEDRLLQILSFDATRPPYACISLALRTSTTRGISCSSGRAREHRGWCQLHDLPHSVRSTSLLTYLDGAWDGATGSGIIGLVLNLLNVWLFPPACLRAYLSVRPFVCLPVLALLLPRFGGFLPASRGSPWYNRNSCWLGVKHPIAYSHWGGTRQSV